MSKRTLLLIVFLTLLTVFFVYLAVSQNKPQITKQSTVAPTKKPSQAFTTLVLKPQSDTFSSRSGAVDVIVNTNGMKNKVTAVQLELSYDPDTLSDVAVAPGTFLPSATPLLNKIDKTSGHITYALAIQPSASGKTGEGVVATITFKSSATGTTPITVLPKTLITAEGIADSVLKEATSAKVSFSSSGTSDSQTPKVLPSGASQR